jgi:hypothetical protein
MATETKPKREFKVTVKKRESSFCDPLVYKIVEDKDINLTIEKAYQFLELETFSGERPVRERHVQFLYDEWVNNRFLWHIVNLAAAKLGDKLYRINGQHTCWMRVSLPADAKCPCTERVYSVPDEEQLRNLYASFDRGASRSADHVNKVLLIGSEAGRGIPASYLSRLTNGFRMFFSEDWRRTPMSPNDIAGLIEKNYSQLFHTVGLFFQIHYEESVPMRRAACIGAMFATFEKNVMASQQFWEPVFNGLGLNDKKDIRYMLRQFISTHVHQIERGFSENGSVIGKEDLYRICINCWNHWRAGDVMKALRPTDKRYKAKA